MSASSDHSGLDFDSPVEPIVTIQHHILSEQRNGGSYPVGVITDDERALVLRDGRATRLNASSQASE